MTEEAVSDEINYLARIDEFQELGFLQEINRQVLHPAGLAMAMHKSDGESTTIRIWDYRDDPEGMMFNPGSIDPVKIQNVAVETMKHMAARKSLFGGSFIQHPDRK